MGANQQMMLSQKRSTGGPAFDFIETFDATGFDNTGWSKTFGGTVNEDYTTTVLSGTQSCFFTSASLNGLTRAITSSGEVQIYFQLKWDGWYSDNILILNDGASDLLRFGDDGAGKFLVQCGSSTAASASTFSLNTVYHVWIRWKKGTGANAIVELYVSTSGTKSSLEASITDGTPTTNATNFDYYGRSGVNAIIDRLIMNFSATTIGNSP